MTGDITTQEGEASTISSTSDAYCVTSPLASTSSTWCIDSLGFSGIGGCSSYQCDPLLVGTPTPWACGDSFTDSRDGNIYTTVEIGTQCWMKKNLAYLPAVHSNAEFANQTTSARYGVYDYNENESVVADAKLETNYSTYGVLYNWIAASTACPTGWHLPTHDEFTDLEREICTSGTCLADFPEDTTTTDWRGTDEGSKLSILTLNGNNSSRFTALMSGIRFTDGSFDYVGSLTYLWSSDEGGAGAWFRYLDASESAVNRDTGSKAYGFSVRCLLD